MQDTVRGYDADLVILRCRSFVLDFPISEKAFSEVYLETSLGIIAHEDIQNEEKAEAEPAKMTNQVK